MEMKQMDVDHTGGQKSISIHIIPTHSIPLSLPQEKLLSSSTNIDFVSTPKHWCQC